MFWRKKETWKLLGFKRDHDTKIVFYKSSRGRIKTRVYR